MKKNNNIKIYPSILSADFSKIADEVKRIEDADADGIHIDIMDGHFVKNLTMGPKMVAAIKRSTKLFLDVHLMMYNPYDYIERFIEAGADLITFHFEATEDIIDTINYIRKCGKKVGIAFNPETSAEFAVKYLDKCDLILFMSVHPGFSGQKFIPSVLEKIETVKTIVDKYADDKKIDIQVDGGINEKTAKMCINAGANILVSGNYIFSNNNLKNAIEKLKGI